MFPSLHHVVRVTALLALATVVGMLLIFLTTGIGQDPLQFVHPVGEYMQLLLKNPAMLRAAIGLDNFFIVFYATTFVALATILLRGGAPRGVVLVTISLLLGAALLDMIENFHFLVMIAGAEQGQPPTPGEIRLQVLESLFKFHVSYLGLFLLGIALPRRTGTERTLANLSWFVQLPVGILIYVTPHGVALPLVFVRFTYFLVALALVAVAYGPRPHELVAADSGAPA
jgi:hypothetical protein